MEYLNDTFLAITMEL